MVVGEAGVSWDDERDAYVIRFDEMGCPPSVAVVKTLTAALDGFDGPLFDHLDPDALDELVATASPSLTVSFEVDGVAVTVHGDGWVVVEEP